MDVADWRESMGAAGFGNQIGLLPLWDALYLTSGGDARAYRAVETNGKALNSHAIIWADTTSYGPIALDDWPRWTVNGDGGGGATAITSGSLKWDVAHHGSGGYFPYLITGDYYYLETMQYQATTVYLVVWVAYGEGTSRQLTPVQTRGAAWGIRTVGQLVSIAPSDPVTDDMTTWLDVGGGQYFASILETPGLNESGFMYATCYAGGEAMCYSDPPYGGVGAFQQNFLVQSFAYVSDLEPLADMSDIDAVKNHLYKIPVGLTGGAGTDSYCYTKAGAYSLQISPERDAKNSPELWFDSWGDIYEASYGAPNTDCGTTLEKTNTSVSEAYKGHWGNFLPTIPMLWRTVPLVLLLDGPG